MNSMVSRRQRKSQKVPWIEESLWSLKGVALLVSAVILGAVIIFIGVNLKQAQTDYIPAEFEGRIVDRWAGSNATQLGDNPYYRLLVEIEGQPRRVPVNREIYEQAQVGMRLRRSSKGLEVFPEIPPR